MKIMQVLTHKALLLCGIEIYQELCFLHMKKKTKSFGVASLEKSCYLR